MVPIDQVIQEFEKWLEEATRHPEVGEPTAMSLATAARDGLPSCRIVLLKHVDKRGFVFYTNMNSHKSKELQENPQTALCFFWQPLARQVRIEGVAQRVPDEEADIYFAARPHGSQIGAWASLQSQPLGSRQELEDRVRALEVQHAGQAVPRPPHWSGWRVSPRRVEFWQGRDSRLHDRWVYALSGDGVYEKILLYP